MNVPGLSSSIRIREARRRDKKDLCDIDLKCFDDVWEPWEWLDWIVDDQVVYIARIRGKAAGFAACILLTDGILIEKIGVKPAFRRRGISMSLLLSAHLKARTRDWPHVMSITIPETFIIPGRDEDISGWTKEVGFKAEPPFHPNYFTINGESIDGVPFLFED